MYEGLCMNYCVKESIKIMDRHLVKNWLKKQYCFFKCYVLKTGSDNFCLEDKFKNLFLHTFVKIQEERESRVNKSSNQTQSLIHI